MLGDNLVKRAQKGRLSAEPFVNEHTESILVTGWARLALNLLRGQVEDGSCHWLGHLLCACDERLRCKHGQAEVTEQHLVTGTEQHILWLDIPVDQALLMGKLQGGSDLLDVVDNRLGWQTCVFVMSLA